MSDQHILEVLADNLAEALQQRIDMMANAFKPVGSRPPFTKQLSEAKALEWWRKHRFDDLGMQVMSKMDQKSLLELDVALSAQNETEMFGGVEDAYS